jgi:hypothetical protein
MAQAVRKLNAMNGSRPVTVDFAKTSYMGTAPTGTYQISSDISVRNSAGGQDGAFEFVTPIVGRETTVEKFKIALDRLREIGARNDSSGGVHIHFQAKGLTWEQQRNWYLNSYLLQPFLLQCVPESWRNRNYAKAIDISTRDAQRMAEATSWSEFRRFCDTQRSRLLNVSGQFSVDQFSGKPTYEYRFPGGGYETDTSMMLVKLLASIRAAGLTGLLQHTTTGAFGDLSRPENREEMLEDLLGQEVYSFWISRIRDISTSSDRSTPGVGRRADREYKPQVSYPMPFNLY